MYFIWILGNLEKADTKFRRGNNGDVNCEKWVSEKYELFEGGRYHQIDQN